MSEACGNESENVFILSEMPNTVHQWINQFVLNLKEQIEVPLFDQWMIGYFKRFAQ